MFNKQAIFLLLAQCAVTASAMKPNNTPNFSLESINFYHDDVDATFTETETEADVHINEKAPVSLFFHGGDLLESAAPPSSSFVAMAECAFMPRDHGNIEDFLDEDDDEDDDDDDGHSSMLSNSSIRKNVSAVPVSVGGGEDSDSYRGSRKMNSGTSLTRPSSMVVNSLKNKSKLSTRSADPLLLNVRGGAQVSASDEFTKRLVTAALVTLLYEGSIGHIFEFLKIAMQTGEPGTRYIDIIRTITSNKGIGGLWDGFIPWGVIQSIFKGGVFGLAHAVAKAHLTPLADKGLMPELMALTLAGGIAGGFQGYVLSPTLLLKTRVMTNPVFREKMSLYRTTMLSFAIGYEVVANEGLPALMKGSNVFALKRVFDWSTRYFFADFFEKMMTQYGFGLNGVLSPKEKIVASLLGGTASTIVTLPLDVIVAKSQDAKKAGVKVSAMETFMKDYKEGGFKQLYDANMQGFEVRLIHVCMTTVVMKTGSGLMYNFLFGDK
jgi:hypothetical protein